MEKEIIKKTLIKENITHGILNKFINVAKESNCENNDFYNKILHKVMEVRQQLLSKGITILELEDIFRKESTRNIEPTIKRRGRKKAEKWYLYILTFL